MVRDAIASVLAQRGVALELIVIDDGSTDGTWDDLYGGELARLLRGAPPGCRVAIDRIGGRGPAAARNRGAELATGDYLAFLDSDDIWAPHKLDRQLAYMQAHPQYPLVQTEEIWIRDGRRVNPGLRHRKRAGDIFEPSLHLCLISLSAVMMRSELFREAGGFDQQMLACEDYDLWLRILRRDPVGLLDEPLVTRRAGHPGQLSTQLALDRFRIRAMVKLLAVCALTPHQKLAVAEVLAGKCRIYANGLRRRGRAQEFGLYSDLGRRARNWLDGGEEPAADYWRAALQVQPLSLEEP